MRRYSVMNELPPAVREKDQTVEQFEADHGHDKQVRGDNSSCMVAQEGRPTLTRSSGAFDHVLGDGRFGDLDPELEQLAMDPRSSPEPVGSAHLPDQVADLLGDCRTAASGPGLPSPEGPEPLPMPANHSLWSDDRDGVHHARAETIEPDEGHPIRIRQRRAPRRTSAQYAHLMAENKILSFELASRLHQRCQPMQQQFDHPKHAAG
jgi:hypothetical protein